MSKNFRDHRCFDEVDRIHQRILPTPKPLLRGVYSFQWKRDRDVAPQQRSLLVPGAFSLPRPGAVWRRRVETPCAGGTGATGAQLESSKSMGRNGAGRVET